VLELDQLGYQLASNSHTKLRDPTYFKAKELLQSPLASKGEILKRQNQIRWMVENPEKRVDISNRLDRICAFVSPTDGNSFQKFLPWLTKRTSFHETEEAYYGILKTLTEAKEIARILGVRMSSLVTNVRSHDLNLQSFFNLFLQTDIEDYLEREVEDKGRGLLSINTQIKSGDLTIDEIAIKKGGKTFKYRDLSLATSQYLMLMFNLLKTKAFQYQREYNLLRDALFQIDLYQALAELSLQKEDQNQRGQYSLPTFIDSPELRVKITNGWHPFVDLGFEKRFVPFNIHLGEENERVIIVTGDNRSGKTTLFRTIGINLVPAQAGMLTPGQVETSIFDNLLVHRSTPTGAGSGMGDLQAEEREITEKVKKIEEGGRSLFLVDQFGGANTEYSGIISRERRLIKRAATFPNALTLLITHHHELAREFEDDPRVRLLNLDKERILQPGVVEAGYSEEGDGFLRDG